MNIPRFGSSILSQCADLDTDPYSGSQTNADLDPDTDQTSESEKVEFT
jgi:hypothetical protein